MQQDRRSLEICEAMAGEVAIDHCQVSSYMALLGIKDWLSFAKVLPYTITSLEQGAV